MNDFPNSWLVCFGRAQILRTRLLISVLGKGICGKKRWKQQHVITAWLLVCVRAQSPSVITFITLDLRTNSKALLKEINTRVSEEEKALRIIFLSVPYKLNQASVWQPGLSVCLSVRLLPALLHPSKLWSQSDAKFQALNHVPSQKNSI